MSKMISSSEIKKDMTYIFENKYYKCMELTYISGSLFSRRKSHVKVVAKRINDGAIVEMILYPNDSVKQIDLSESKMTFVYDDGVSLCFMNPDTCDTIEVSNTKFEWEKNFLTGDLEVSCLVCENEIIKINLPDEVCLTLISCEEINRSKPVKNAVCETGLKVQVPLFTNVNDRICVSTLDGTYTGRAR